MMPHRRMTLWSALTAAVLAAALAVGPRPAVALTDLMLVSRVEAALAVDRSEAHFAPLEDAIRDPLTTPEERLDLLAELARLRSAHRYHLEAANAYAAEARLMARLEGPRAPDLAAIHASAAAAWLVADRPLQALTAAGAALALDRTYFDCASEVVARDHALLAAVYRALGRNETALKEATRSRDAVARCEGVAGLGSRGVVVTNEFAGADDDSFARVKVFYATDRARTGSNHPNDFYGGQRGAMDYGVLEVTVPRSHKPGAVEAPSLVKLEWSENPERHFVITRIETMGDGELFADIRRTLGERGSDEAFVFVHGYNVTFAKAARRTAQMAYDLSFDGAPILYSWPSRGTLFAYVRDEAVVRLSGRHLLRFLDDMIGRSGARRINLVAHSMGNRALIDALELMAVRRAGEGRHGPVFEQIIFAAPDEDAALFAEMLATVRPLARRITLYGSDKDLALAASERLHGDDRRAGQAGERILIADGIDSIDMSGLGADMLGHGYFAASTSALTDMSWLFWRDAPPERRCGMDGRARPEGRFWLFDPVACDGPVLMSALTLLKASGAAALARLDGILARVIAEGRDDEAAEWQAIRHAAATALAAP